MEARVPMIALKTWTNTADNAEGHVAHGGSKGHVKRGKKFEAISESRAKQLEQRGLAMRDPEFKQEGGGAEVAGANPPRMSQPLPGVPAPSGAPAASSSSSEAGRAQHSPTSPQFTKPAGSEALARPPAKAPPVKPPGKSR